jgi:hypothetical protein
MCHVPPVHECYSSIAKQGCSMYKIILFLLLPLLEFFFSIDKHACAKLKSRLASAHSKFCLYSTNQVPDSVLEIEHVSNMELQDTIQGQLLAFKNIEALCKVSELQDEVRFHNTIIMFCPS